MRSPHTRRARPRKIDLNLTSMLDIVFQLIVFFLLITNFAAAELPDLDPPEPDEFVIEDDPQRMRLVVNVMPDLVGDRVHIVRAGTRDFALPDAPALTAHLRERRAEHPYIDVDLRAHRDIHYVDMHPVMRAIAKAGIDSVNVVAREPQEP